MFSITGKIEGIQVLGNTIEWIVIRRKIIYRAAETKLPSSKEVFLGEWI